MSNQADARRRAQNELASAKRNGADKRTIGQLEAKLNAAKAAESSAKSGSGGAISRALGW